jgi:hypothetical protein
MLDNRLRAVGRAFARHQQSYVVCEGCVIHEAEVRAIWATPRGALSGAQLEWVCTQTGHFDHESMGYYWPAILEHLVREPIYAPWWEALFIRLYAGRERFTRAERQAIEAVLVGLVEEPGVAAVEQAIIAAFLAFWAENTAVLLELITDDIRETWRQILAEPEPFGEPTALERLWYLAKLRRAPRTLRDLPLERCLFLEELLEAEQRIELPLLI